MKTKIGCLAVLAITMGIVQEAGARETSQAGSIESHPVDSHGAVDANRVVLAAATTLVYDKKADACSEAVGPNTKYSPDSLSGYNIIRPELDAIYSFVKDPTTEAGGAEYDRMMKGVQVTVVTPPKHGKLLPVQVNESKGYFYMAEPGYFGVDKVVFSIKFGNGKTILLNNIVSVVGSPSMGEQINPCPDTPANYQWMRKHLPEIKKAWEDTYGSQNEYVPIAPDAIFLSASGAESNGFRLTAVPQNFISNIIADLSGDIAPVDHPVTARANRGA